MGSRYPLEVAILLNRKRSITKLTLFLRAKRYALVLSIIIGTAFVFNFLGRGTASALPSASIYISGMMLAIVLFFVLFSLRSLYWLKEQEHFLGFRFREEMKKYHITRVPYSSANWFIVVEQGKIVVFRKDYIIRLKNYEKIRIQFITYEYITIVGADGKDRRLRRIPQDTLIVSDLQEWVNGNPDVKNEKNTEKDRTNTSHNNVRLPHRR